MPDADRLSLHGSKSVDAVHPAEQFCLSREGASPDDVLQLLSLLDSELPSRGQAGPNTFSWTSGAYAKGPLRGLRKHSSSFPACTRLLCRLVLQSFPDADFTAVAIFKNLQTALHVDVNNDENSCNYLIPITSFEGGEVWQQGPGSHVVQDELGYDLVGSLLPVAAGPCVLNPRCTHCTLPWVGDRVLVVAFKPKHASDLSPAFREQLLGLGFPAKSFNRVPAERQPCAEGSDLPCPSNPNVQQEVPQACLSQDNDSSNTNVQPAAQTAFKQNPSTEDVRWHDPLILEFFSGNGRVTASMKQLGLSAFGVDADPSKSVTTCLPADLSTSRGQALCREWFASPRLAGIFATPACQAEDANTFLSELLTEALSRGIVCVLGNPLDSAYWQSYSWTQVSASFSFVHCHECAYDGEHFKSTVFAVSDRMFDKLSRFCPGHACKADRSCGQLTSYPIRLAMQVACCFAEVFQQKGWRAPPSCFDAFDSRLEVPMARAVAGTQPPASKMPPIVSEHKQVWVLRHPPGVDLPCQPMQRLKSSWRVPPECSSPHVAVPAKAQLLRHVPIAQGGGADSMRVSSWEMAWGIPWEPEEFMRQAEAAKHPRTLDSVLPQPLKDTLDALEIMDDAEVTALRARVIKEWMHLAVSLAKEEDALKASMHPDVRSITQSKRILLWEALLEKYSYPDRKVSSLLREGVPLVGHAPISGVFKPKFKPMQATPGQVKEDFLFCRKKVHNSLKPQEPALMKEVAEKTRKELDAGWIAGPLREADLGAGILVSRRFGLQQGPKVRCIDNLTSSGVNLAVQAYEAPQPQSTDVVASTCQRLLKHIEKQVGTSTFVLLGKAFDLTSAYRQMPVHPDSAWASYIRFIHPDTCQRVYFRMRAMPFGSSMAVYSFLRISHSLWYIGTKALLLPWSSFFDDYITFATTGQSKSAEHSVTAMLRLLGWAFAESGDKSHEFSQCFQALGIVVDLSSVLQGTVYFRNTERRISEIRSFVGKILASGRLPHHEALRLRGRCQFADSQVFGRTGKRCLGLITSHAFSFVEEIGPELRAELHRFVLRLEVEAPRLIKIFEGGAWKVYTDASYEPGAKSSFCGLGGVLVNPKGVPLKFFSFVLSDPQKVFLGEKVSSQIIFPAEMLALAIALDAWGDDLRGSPSILFVDNNGVRDAAISGNARSSVARRILELLLQKEYELSIVPWYARVPSPSNPADEPSRVECDRLCLLGAELRKSEVASLVEACLQKVQGLK